MLKQIKRELEALRGSGLEKQFVPRDSRKDGVVEFKGQKLIDFTNWDFLGVGEESKIKRVIQSEIENFGFGANSSRLSSGTTRAHLSCEDRLAKFIAQEKTVLFSSPNQAILTLVSALSGETDVFFVDELLYGPFSDAAYLVNAEVIPFNSIDVDGLAVELEKSSKFRRRFVVVPGVSYIDGSIAPLKQLSSISAKFDSYLVVDESSSIGVMGARGAGIVEFLGLEKKIFCQYSGLGHGVAGYGAFIGASRPIIDYLINVSRTFQSEVAIPGPIAALIEASVNFVELQSFKRKHLGVLSGVLRNGLKDMGILAGSEKDESPIVGVVFEKFSDAKALEEGLFQRGFLIDRFQPDLVENDVNCLRFLLNVAHSEKVIHELLQAISDIKLRLNI